jgi:protein-tyrosine-phosphatase
MTPCPLNEEDLRIRLEEARHLADPYAKQQYEIIRDAVEQCCTEILEEKT